GRAAEYVDVDIGTCYIGRSGFQLSFWLGGGLGAVGVEGARQLLGDCRGRRGLDGRPLHEVDQLAVAEDGDGWGGGRVSAEVAAGALGGVAVLSGEDGYG